MTGLFGSVIRIYHKFRHAHKPAGAAPAAAVASVQRYSSNLLPDKGTQLFLSLPHCRAFGLFFRFSLVDLPDWDDDYYY